MNIPHITIDDQSRRGFERALSAWLLEQHVPASIYSQLARRLA